MAKNCDQGEKKIKYKNRECPIFIKKLNKLNLNIFLDLFTLNDLLINQEKMYFRFFVSTEENVYMIRLTRQNFRKMAK